MNQELILKLNYSYSGQSETTSLPSQIQESIQLISNYFENNSNNKLCLVFPSKELAAQWISFILAFQLIEQDYRQFNTEIYKAYEKYKPGQKLLLNNKAIVEWVTGNEEEIKFKTKGKTIKSRPWENTQGDIITVRTSRIVKLRPAPQSRKVLSARESVYSNLSGISQTPIDTLLSINTCDNLIFQKNSIALVSKFKDFDNSHYDVLINGFKTEEYFKASKIYENGSVAFKSPLLIANNLSNIALYSVINPIAKIIIDGFAAIHERTTDFADIDVKNIPTILITDLSEIERFEAIGNFGFDFFNFTKENIDLSHFASLKPFRPFEIKLRNYISLNVIKEICHDAELELASQKIYSIEKDESNNELTLLKLSLVQLINFVSRISHILTASEIIYFNSKVAAIETLFFQCRRWLGDSHKAVEESISILKSAISKLTINPSEKYSRLKLLLSSKKYEYIICPTKEEAKALSNSFHSPTLNLKVISIADVNDKLLSENPQKAILTGWAKSNNINRLLSSFLFSEITILFYQFENKYYNSLQRRNQMYAENIKATINSMGFRAKTESSKQKGFEDFYKIDPVVDNVSNDSIDVLDFELKLDNAQYSKYAAKGNLIDSIKAKRILFENNYFVYATDSHKFLIVNELFEKKPRKGNLHRRKVDSLQNGDIIAIINTDRDILIELVEKNTNTKELASVKQWTELWKNLLREYYISNGSDFKKLVEDLRKNDCKKHEVTIRTWLQDEGRIGPDDNADLISIALLTNSELLNDNIHIVREAIRKMTGWRMKASDYITDKIKTQIHEFANKSIINKKVSIEGLGSVFVIKVIEISNTWENIDIRYVNRLLPKEIF